MEPDAEGIRNINESSTTTSLPLHTEVYGGSKEFWNARYSVPKYNKYTDWYCNYSVLKSHQVFTPYLLSVPKQRILIVGCGNSTLSASLFEDGYTDITNIDVSSVIIEQMRQKYPHMEYLTMDVSQMSFPDNTFDLVLDKGTLDAVCCGKDCSEFVHRMCMEVCRVLKEGGRYVCMSYGPPFLRTRHLLKGQLRGLWRMDHRKVQLDKAQQTKCLSVLEDDDSGTFHVYALTKQTTTGRTGQDDEDEEDEEDATLKKGAFLENPVYKKCTNL